MTYALLFIAALLCELALCVPMGSMPLALVDGGASESQVAMVMGAGAVAALFVSIPLGVLVDRVGRLPVMKASILGCTLVLVAMATFHGVIAGCVEMALRSFMMIAFVTAQFAYVGSMFSKERAVSAVSSMGIVGNIAFALGPAAGVWMWQQGIHHEQYLYSCVLSIVAALVVYTLPKKYDLSANSKKSKKQVYFRRAWMPAFIFILFVSLQAGVNFSLAVLEFQSRGITNGALLFTAAALTTVVFRYFAGRLVETYGPRLIAIPTALFQAVGCIIAAFATEPWMLIIAGLFMGTAWSAVPPIGFALFFECISERTRGAAMGAYCLAMWGGIAIGSGIATIAAWLGFGYTEAIIACALSPFIALVYIHATQRKKRPVRAGAA